MKPGAFSYHRATSLEDATAALRSADGMAKVLAGGQSLVPMLNLRLAPADLLVDVNRIASLRETVSDSDTIRYGALTTHAAFEDRTVPDGSNGLMPFVARRIAYRAVRTRGTIGGALALADPSADWLAAAIALEASVEVVGASGQRTVPVAELVIGPYMALLEDDEIIERVAVPRRLGGERWGYSKVALKVGEYAKSLAIVLLDAGRAHCRAVLGAVDGAAPLVLERTAQALLDGAAGPDLAAVVRRELDESDYELTAAQLTLHATTVARAAEDARAQ